MNVLHYGMRVHAQIVLKSYILMKIYLILFHTNLKPNLMKTKGDIAILKTKKTQTEDRRQTHRSEYRVAPQLIRQT